MNNLIIANTSINVNNGLYSLNDLHKASGGEEKDAPSRFIRLDSTKALIEEISNENNRQPETGIEPIKVIRGGDGIQGTFVCKELVYAYAMWISPAFNLKVIRAFDAMANASKAYDDDDELLMIAKLAMKMSETRKQLSRQRGMIEYHEVRIDRTDEVLEQTIQELDEAKFRIKELLGDQVYFTAMASGKFYGKTYYLQAAQKVGRRLSQLSREMGYEISERANRDYASVGVYHIDVIVHYHEVEQGLTRSKKLEHLLYKLAGS